MTFIGDLLDRIHNINGTIPYSKLSAYRYYPGTVGKIPYIIPLLGGSTHNVSGSYTGGESLDLISDTQVTLLCALASPNTGVPLETAHIHAENIIDPVLDTYHRLPELQYNNNEFDGIRDAISITNDSGIVFSQLTNLFEVRFTLTVPLYRYIGD